MLPPMPTQCPPTRHTVVQTKRKQTNKPNKQNKQYTKTNISMLQCKTKNKTTGKRRGHKKLNKTLFVSFKLQAWEMNKE
jgi:hypothetical protein